MAVTKVEDKLAAGANLQTTEGIVGKCIAGETIIKSDTNIQEIPSNNLQDFVELNKTN